jgi:hypothetical protein
MGCEDAIAALHDRLRAHPAVRSIRAIGSRAGGAPMLFSDWEFAIEADFDALSARSTSNRFFEDDLPALVASSRPLAAFRDPFVDHAGYMGILDGPCKVDLDIFGALNPEPRTAWDPARDPLNAIDTHFWDWTLWLAAKVLGGKDAFVRDELAKMQTAILGPFGVARPPATLAEAVRAYLGARELHTARRGASIDDTLGQQVRRALAEHGVIPTG